MCRLWLSSRHVADMSATFPAKDENNIDATHCCAAYYNDRDVWVPSLPSPMLVCGGCDDLEENDGGGLTLSESGRSHDNDGDNGWAPNNVVVEGRSRVVHATNEDNVDRICPYPHNRAFDKGGDDDGYDKNDGGGGSCTPEATRGGRERASSSLAGVDFPLYEDSGRRDIARLCVCGSCNHLITVIVPMQVTQVRRGMSLDFPHRWHTT